MTRTNRERLLAASHKLGYTKINAFLLDAVNHYLDSRDPQKNVPRLLLPTPKPSGTRTRGRRKLDGSA